MAHSPTNEIDSIPDKKITTACNVVGRTTHTAVSKSPALINDWESVLSEYADLDQFNEESCPTDFTKSVISGYRALSNQSLTGAKELSNPLCHKSIGLHEKNPAHTVYHQRPFFTSTVKPSDFRGKPDMMQETFAASVSEIQATNDRKNQSVSFTAGYLGAHGASNCRPSRFDEFDDFTGGMSFSDSNGSWISSAFCPPKEGCLTQHTSRNNYYMDPTVQTPTFTEYWVSEIPGEDHDVWTVGSITDGLPAHDHMRSEKYSHCWSPSSTCIPSGNLLEVDEYDSETSWRPLNAGVTRQTGKLNQRTGGQTADTPLPDRPLTKLSFKTVRKTVSPAVVNLNSLGNIEPKPLFTPKCVRWVEKQNINSQIAQSGVSYASSSACGAHGSTSCGKSLHGIHKTFAADIRPIELCSRSSSHHVALMSAGVSDAGDCWCLHPNQIPIDYSEHPCRPAAEENRCTENLRPITPHLESSLHRRISYEDQRARRSSRHRKLSSHSRRMSTTESYTKNGQSLAVSKGPVQAGRSNRSRAENTDVMPHRKNSRQESNHAARLSQHETASLIQVIESLRESIETSNARLEIELNSVEPVSSVRMRKQALAISTNTSYHRTSMAINRGSRFKFPKHDTARRTPFHRRADEPGQNRSDKVSVEVRVVFLKIGEIDTLKEYYYADAFIQAKWREPKLDGRTVDEPTVTELEQFWNPQIYIDNILSETKETQWLVAQKNEAGEMYLVERRRIKGVFLETLELNDFPLDVQDLTITVTTERPETEVDIIPDQNEMSAINIQTFVDQQEWKLHEHVEVTKRILKQEYSSSMKNHACLSVTCRAARRPGYFYWNVFLIMFMISSLSFATFAVSPDKAELRLRLSFTLILTSVTFKYVITQSLPKISYLTYMDKYVLMSLGILCIISIWHAVVTLFDPDHIALRTGQFGSSSEPLASESPHTFMQTDENTTHWWMDESNASMLINSAISKFWLGSSPGGLKSDFFQSDSDTDGNGDAESGDQKVNHTTVIENVSEECSLNNKMACEEWRHVQTVEQHVFVSFVIIYVIAHAVFIFWLYFDASRRRREMRQKDKEYRKQKRKAGV